MQLSMHTHTPKNLVVERRRHPRTSLRVNLTGIRLDPDCGDVLDTLHMLDISRSGMGAVSTRPFYPGQRVVLDLPLSSTHGKRRLYATVVRCRGDEEGYRLGMEFDGASVQSWVPWSGYTAAA